MLPHVCTLTLVALPPLPLTCFFHTHLASWLDTSRLCTFRLFFFLGQLGDSSDRSSCPFPSARRHPYTPLVNTARNVYYLRLVSFVPTHELKVKIKSETNETKRHSM